MADQPRGLLLEHLVARRASMGRLEGRFAHLERRLGAMGTVERAPMRLRQRFGDTDRQRARLDRLERSLVAVEARLHEH